MSDTIQSQVVTVHAKDWHDLEFNPHWVQAVEDGKVLYLPNFGFSLKQSELTFLTPKLLAPSSRNISLDSSSHLKGAVADFEKAAFLKAMLLRYKEHSLQLINTLLPAYSAHLRLAPTSFRPAQVESRIQSWRADDKRLHIDAFPSRPNRGERILRVFANINPNGQSRVWRVGEPFDTVAQKFLPRCKSYSRWQAKALNMLGITKSFRSEYDHLMLQLHDLMKSDLDYQAHAPQETVLFPPNSMWICFSDQTSHAAMSGQFMMEQTMHLEVDKLYQPLMSPFNVLANLTHKPLN
jgi:3-deoxy-D-manno-oct-2-ulosonic acid (Kdo) hydroxylase